ncbi:hypothetical protein CUJ84_pRLN5000126 (plasmid) [Rhizobium leguminosarum]|uniref:Uncharacterized protein n=1 Tax=Rhizobium leguminosarum TaxID=384 RepID=A0A2K9ZIV1_RHILE|nr:hypothetical protein CUJ84_pRLN5000126 [Rhizobium leguminosarum]
MQSGILSSPGRKFRRRFFVSEFSQQREPAHDKEFADWDFNNRHDPPQHAQDDRSGCPHRRRQDRLSVRRLRSWGRT